MTACIFDLDGVIVDTAKYHFLAWKKLADELGIIITEQDNERLKGVGRLESLDVILSLGNIKKTKEEKEFLANKKNDWFVGYIENMKKDEIFPGVSNLLNELRRNKIKVGLASSSKNAQSVIEKLEIGNLFDEVVDGTMVTHSKPDPEIFLTTSKRLGVDPSSCVVVEDAAAGVESAKRAGMKCIGVGDPQQLKVADKVVKLTGDINLDLVRNLSKS